MKSVSLLLAAIVLSIAATGCHTTPPNFTNLPSRNEQPRVLVNTNGDRMTPDANILTTEAPVLPNPTDFDGWIRTRETFAALTVHFDYDSTVVKSEENSKLRQIADYLKAHPSNALSIEGHCDERGTEEYNRSLGDRRALALREALAKLEVVPSRLDTVSYGKDRPVDTGKGEAANRLNRRGEFVVLSPP